MAGSAVAGASGVRGDRQRRRTGADPGLGVECADPGRCVVNAVSGDLLRYAQQVLTGTGHAPDQVASVVAGTGEDAAARALRAGWECAANPAVLAGEQTEEGS